jgi:hypothetical protein
MVGIKPPEAAVDALPEHQYITCNPHHRMAHRTAVKTSSFSLLHLPFPAMMIHYIMILEKKVVRVPQTTRGYRMQAQ